MRFDERLRCAPASSGIHIIKEKFASSAVQMQTTGKMQSKQKCFGLVDLLGGGVGVGESELFHRVFLGQGRAADGWRRRSGVGDGSALELALTGEVEGLAELSAGLAFDAVVHGVENGVDDETGNESCVQCADVA